jgi:hypothetical protein
MIVDVIMAPMDKTKRPAPTVGRLRWSDDAAEHDCTAAGAYLSLVDRIDPYEELPLKLA